MNLETLILDIPLDVARAAHSGTSFSPEKRAESERAGYVATLKSDFEALAELADTDEKRATLEAEFERYREGYRARVLAHLRSSSRCVSWMIAGPSNFPARRMQKRSDIAHRRMTEVIEYRKAALEAIRRKLRPELRPIMAGDANAAERLRAKIDQAEALQAQMKAANATIRKHAKAGPAAQVQALTALGFSEARAAELLKPDFCGRIGFADYELTNNNANIRRMKSRLVGIERNKAAEATTTEGAAATVEDCPADNRVRLTFPGKPAAEVRARLKSAGFRWAPSLGVWQAYRNDRTLEVAQLVADGK